MNRIIFRIKMHFFLKWTTCNQISEEGFHCHKDSSEDYFWLCNDCLNKFTKMAKKHNVEVIFQGEDNE